MTTRNQGSGTSPWVWFGCGCLLLMVLGIGACVGLGAWGAKEFQTIVDEMADPAARERSALDALGAESMPLGYSTVVSFRIPMAFKLVALTESPESAEATEDASLEGASFEEKVESLEALMLDSSKLGDRTFLYLDARGREADDQLERVLSGDERIGAGDINLNLEFEFTEALGSGELEHRGSRLLFATHRGRVDMAGGAFDALWSSVDWDCGDRRPGALWIERLAPDAPAAGLAGDLESGDEFPWAGTVADPDEIARFMAALDPCG